MSAHDHPNGQVPDSELAYVDAHGTKLCLVTASMWAKLQADAQAAGHTIYITVSGQGPIGGYRDLAQQQYLYDHPIGPAPIAPPGSSSHGWGDVLDISANTPAQRWLEQHQAAYGIRQTIASEPWHWEHDGATTAGGGPVAPITEESETEMRFILIAGDKTGWTYPYLYDALTGRRRVVSQAELSIMRSSATPEAGGGPKYPEVAGIAQKDFDAIPVYTADDWQAGGIPAEGLRFEGTASGR